MGKAIAHILIPNYGNHARGEVGDVIRLKKLYYRFSKVKFIDFCFSDKYWNPKGHELQYLRAEGLPAESIIPFRDNS